MKIWGAGLGVMMLAVGLSAACSDAGNAGHGGAGGACPSHTLQDYCDQLDCPRSSDEVDLICRLQTPVRQTSFKQPSSCGDAVVVSSGLGSVAYHYDENDELVSVVETSDALTRCAPEGVTVYGAECELEGDPVDACGCSPEPLSAACDPGWCPESPDDLSTSAGCSRYPASEEFESSCGAGSVIRTHVGFGVVEYTFDGQGALVGILSQDDVDQECADGSLARWGVYGAPCDRVGSGAELCGVGGVGAAGNAGAGGAP
jgi:YD repeat-containing protein